MTELPPDYPMPPPGGGYGPEGYPNYPNYPGNPEYPGYSGYPGGYPPAAGYPAAGYPPKQDTNGMAIASLVSGLVGLFCVVGSVLGVIFGVVALNQIRTTGQQGRGMAISGIIVSGLTMGGAVVLLATMMFLGATTSRHHRDYYDYSAASSTELCTAPRALPV
ncbi:DUF4190 domain-containing protein [Mycobacterium sp.]|uniref:DUF4190 domain-containing protein n=1 Tax=Mycobacterium sp. TaxID=1785 RepID=UPI003A867E89